MGYKWIYFTIGIKIIRYNQMLIAWDQFVQLFYYITNNGIVPTGIVDIEQILKPAITLCYFTANQSHTLLTVFFYMNLSTGKVNVILQANYNSSLGSISSISPDNVKVSKIHSYMWLKPSFLNTDYIYSVFLAMVKNNIFLSFLID